MQDVRARFLAQRERQPSLRLYALVDGLQYKQLREVALAPGEGVYALFTGTRDAALAAYGPWLLDVDQVGEAKTNDIAELEHAAPSVVWLMAIQDLDGLGQLLQLHLEMRLPNGQEALLRYWDPRVLISLAKTLEPEQREHLLGDVHEWLFLHEGQRVYIGRPAG